jgi:hypothetical protein
VLGTALVAGVEGATIILDQPADRYTNAIVEWPDHQCAGWLIQNCHWDDNYQRLLIQSGPGTVRHCAFTRQGSAIELNSVMPYVEGSVPHDITIADNVFTDVNPAPQGATITVYSHTFGRAAPVFSNIVITGNTFVRSGDLAIALSHASGGIIASNRFESPLADPDGARSKGPGRPRAIRLRDCPGFRVEANVPDDPADQAAPPQNFH